MKIELNPLHIALVYGLTFTITDVIKGFVPGLCGPWVRLVALLIAIVLSIGLHLVEVEAFTGRAIFFAVFQGFILGVWAIKTADLRDVPKLDDKISAAVDAEREKIAAAAAAQLEAARADFGRQLAQAVSAVSAGKGGVAP